jgi:hypothetical protein
LEILNPIALVLLMATAVIEKILVVWGLPATLGGQVIRASAHFIANFVIVWITVVLLKRTERKSRQPVAEPRPLAIAQKSS